MRAHQGLDTHLHRETILLQGSRQRISANAASGRSSMLVFLNFDDDALLADGDELFDPFE